MEEKPRLHVEIGARIQVIREALGLRQIDMCRRLGISASRYNQWEQGVTRPPVDAAVAFCEATGATLDWIFRGDPTGLPIRFADLVHSRRSTFSA